MANCQFIAEKERLLDHHHVLLITTGSVASIKAPLIVTELLQVCPSSWSHTNARAHDAHANVVQECQSRSCCNERVTGVLRPYGRGQGRWTLVDRWRWVVSKYIVSRISATQRPRQGSYKIGDPILHIELRRWADIVLVAPCSANTLSKIAHGLCDNLAVCCIAYSRLTWW
jgi:phosphopantothenoylcysteine decarboxylase